MPWTHQQKDELLGLVDLGWKQQCQEHKEFDPVDITAKVKWYHTEMLICTGHPGIEHLGNQEAYDIVIAHFEELNNKERKP